MSQTRTQTLHRTVVNPTRNHDYLYDPVYTLSSDQDHARDAYRSHTNVDRIKRVPEHKQMFSALPHFPRYQLRLEAVDPVPKFINRRWRGYADQHREALIRYKTCNYDPAVQVPAVKYQNAKVSGQNRYKYFRRPIIPFLQQVPPEVLLQPTTVDPLAPPGELLKRVPTPGTRTVEIQTDYRDSEAQTDPYTPEYVVRPGSAPELLTLATLTHTHGLPAGLAEVEMIERARAKRAWEKTLPSLNDVSQLEKRKRMMDEMETKEWQLREQEIEKLQEERLEVLKKLLVQREIKQLELNDKRLDKLWTKKQKIKEGKILKIRKDHIKTIRRLTRNCKNVEQKFERKDFVQEYSGFGSQVHAPMTRMGVFLDRGSEQYVVRSRYLNTFQGLLELEASLPDFVTHPRIRAPQKPLTGAFGYVKKKYRLTKQLEDTHKAIIEAKKKGKEVPKPLRFLHKVEKPIPRPPTPTTDVPSEELENAELASIFIQKVIRGRAIQNMMYEGKEKRLELVNEVRTTHALQKAEQQLKKAERQNVVTLQRQRRLYQHKESYVNEIVSQVEGESIGDLFDFLSKELIRLQEERRIHAFSMLAERRRRLREAEESGRRQVEERRRREEDEIFKQLVKIHQTTVDTYLEDILMTAVDDTADEQARNEIRQLADKINDVAYEMEERRTLLQSEEIVSELVHCFLIPEILKVNCRDKIKEDQKKHILAAHRIIHATTEPILSQSEDTSQVLSQSRQSDPASSRGTELATPSQQMSPEGSSRRAMLAMQMLAGSKTPTDDEDANLDEEDAAVDTKRTSQPQTPTEKPSSGPLPSVGAVFLEQDSQGVQSQLEGDGMGSSAAASTPDQDSQKKSSDLVDAESSDKAKDDKDSKREAPPVLSRTEPALPTELLPTSQVSTKSLLIKSTPHEDVIHVEPHVFGSPPSSPQARKPVPALPAQDRRTSESDRKSEPSIPAADLQFESPKEESRMPDLDKSPDGDQQEEEPVHDPEVIQTDKIEEDVKEEEPVQDPEVIQPDKIEEDTKEEKPVQDPEVTKPDKIEEDVKKEEPVQDPEVIQPDKIEEDTKEEKPVQDPEVTKPGKIEEDVKEEEPVQDPEVIQPDKIEEDAPDA